MKDQLAEYRLRNIFPKNKTQTSYYRFKQMPHTELKSLFTDIKEEMKLNKPIKTFYWDNENV